MATRQPFWKWHIWKSMGFYPYIQVMCQWGLNLIFKAKLKLESENYKNPLWQPCGHFESHIVTWVTLWKPCHLQTNGQTDRQTGGQGESSIPPSLSTNFIMWGCSDMNPARTIIMTNQSIVVDSPACVSFVSPQCGIHRAVFNTSLQCIICHMLSMNGTARCIIYHRFYISGTPQKTHYHNVLAIEWCCFVSIHNTMCIVWKMLVSSK